MRKVVLITGATDGIGKMTALRLAEQGHDIIVHGRDGKKVATTVSEIKTKIKSSELRIETSIFDLGSLASVRSGAEDLKRRFSHIDVLVNNAGTYQVERQTSPEGFELTMAINHLGPTLLTLLLKPLLSSSSSKGSRVIFVSSIAHKRAQIDINDFNFETRFSPYGAYSASKLANIVVTQRLAQEWRDVSVYALHPGVISTKLLKLGFSIEGDSVEKGAECSVFLADQFAGGQSGDYFVDCKSTEPSGLVEDEGEAIWQWTLLSLEGFLR